ncbi:MAG TPA: Gfo/Idh/MocA family oxidoreductase [Vicinamibacterales bacterium]|nr:Gfo/Idh/MocA family oxidoreductase [Vicinamibacterales bacterium]
MADVNVALIGYAFMGRAHSNAYRQVGPFFSPRLTPRMKVLCGRTASEVDRAARQLGWEEAATDWREVVGRPDIHLVDVSTPGDSHAEIAIAAAEAGKAVICEKPLANSVREAEAMLAAVQKARVPHMVCHNYRRVPAIMLARHMIADGKIGRIHHFRGAYLQDWLVDPQCEFVWRLDRQKAGSGALGDIGSHTIDLARFLVGEITEVAATLTTFVKDRPIPGDPARRGAVTVDDAVAAVVRFENGAIGTIEATRFATGRKNANRIEINGSLGSIAFDLERLNELQVFFSADAPTAQGFRTVLVTDRAHHPYMRAWWPSGHLIGYEHTFTHTVFDLLEAMASGTPASPGFDEGVRNQRLLQAIELAWERRAWVRVDEVS